MVAVLEGLDEGKRNLGKKNPPPSTLPYLALCSQYGLEVGQHLVRESCGDEYMDDFLIGIRTVGCLAI